MRTPVHIDYANTHGTSSNPLLLMSNSQSTNLIFPTISIHWVHEVLRKRIIRMIKLIIPYRNLLISLLLPTWRCFLFMHRRLSRIQVTPNLHIRQMLRLYCLFLLKATAASLQVFIQKAFHHLRVTFSPARTWSWFLPLRHPFPYLRPSILYL